CRGVEDAAAVERASQDVRIEKRHVVDDGISQVHPDRVVAVPGANFEQPCADEIIGLLPRNLSPSERRAPEGAAQPIRVLVQFLDPVGLGAYESPRKGIIFVATNAHNRIAIDFDHHTASCLAEGTDSWNQTTFLHRGPPHLDARRIAAPRSGRNYLRGNRGMFTSSRVTASASMLISRGRARAAC